jgi:hypothetical protein
VVGQLEDELRLHQAVTNLHINACERTPLFLTELVDRAFERFVRAPTSPAIVSAVSDSGWRCRGGRKLSAPATTTSARSCI